MKNFGLGAKIILRKQTFYKSICVLLIPIFVFLLSSVSFCQTNEYEYQVPKKLNDGWEVSSLKDESIDEETIEEVSGLIRDTNMSSVC